MLSRAVAAAAAVVTMGAALTTLTAAATVPAGSTCPCALPSAPTPAATCTKALPSTGGPLRCAVSPCEASWVCTDESVATHVCKAFDVRSVATCTGGTPSGDGRRSCPCSMRSVTAPTTSLTPWQTKSAQGRSGYQQAPPPKPVWTPSVKPYTAPMAQRCTTTHVSISVEGRPFVCVQPIRIGRMGVQAAYNLVDWSHRGWQTFNDWVNVAFVQDAAARLYLCTTMGDEGRTRIRGDRHARSTYHTAGDTTWYVQDDTTAKNPRDRYGVARDRSRGGGGGGGSIMTAINTWADATTDGWCVAASADMTLHFDNLVHLKGVAFLRGGHAWPRSGGAKGFSMTHARALYRERWTLAGCRSCVKMSLYRRGQNPRLRNIRMKPVCSCPAA